MPNSWLILAVVLALGGTWLAGDWHGHKTERTTWEARIQKERADAAEQARAVEREQQKEITDAMAKQYWDQVAVADGLAADLERLRNRPERPAGVPQAPRADCQGANGAELSGADARFLAGLAARADRLRAALAACYSYADTVTEPWTTR